MPVTGANVGINTAGTSDNLTRELTDSATWSDAMVTAAGIPIRDVPFVSVGGGVGSFVTVDYLRIAGVPASQIRVLSNLEHPWQTYEYLARVSQIPRRDRIRSDSSSRPDNIWGFPSYALSEAWQDRSLRPLVHVLLEPVFADYWTPRIGMVLAGLQRESDRIRYPEMLVKGLVRTVRRRDLGGYFTVLTPSPGTAPCKPLAFRSRFVHLAMGYPGLGFMADLKALRHDNGDFQHVVNAYEPHEHVYEFLKIRPGTVVVRGGGIVASRVLQRLMDDRQEYGLQTQIVHIFRTFVPGPHGPHPFSRRKGGHGWAYQGFNYPKSVWGGQLKARMRRLDGHERARVYEQMGGTTTPKRRRWQHQMRAGRRQGWYRPTQGTVVQINAGVEGTMTCLVNTARGPREIGADYVVDCTGLEADVAENPVIADLLAHGLAGRNPLGRLEVERHFEIKGAASGDGTLYASGAVTLGGYFPGADTFLGLQIAAQEIADDLAGRGWCHRIGPLRASTQWFRWAFGRPV